MSTREHALVENSPDTDLLREMIGFAAEKLMEMKVEAATGAGYGEKNPLRFAQRNGGETEDDCMVEPAGLRCLRRRGLCLSLMVDCDPGDGAVLRVRVSPPLIPGRSGRLARCFSRMAGAKRAIIFVHVGLHKTGTTWLQRAYWPCWSGLTYVGKPWRVPYKALPGELDLASGDRFLMSSESLGGSLKKSYRRGGQWSGRFEDHIRRIAEEFEGHDLRFLISLREHRPWLESVYKHYLKYGGTASAETFVAGFTKANGDLVFSKRIETLKRYSDHVFAFHIEEFRDNRVGLENKLEQFTSGGRPGGETDAGRRFNEGMSANEARLARALNLSENAGCAPFKLRKITTRGYEIAKRAGLGGEAMRFPADLRVEIESYYAKDREATLALIDELRGGA